MRAKVSLVFVMFLLFGIVPTAVAQTSRGTLTGTVVDSSGATVPKATIKITQQGTGITRETTTNSAGLYRFDAVELGIYNVSAQASGFTTEEKTGIPIEAAHTSEIGFTLKVGGSNQVVTVEATGAEVGLQTTEQVHSEVLSELSVSKLPALAGDSLTLAQLAPGVAIGSIANQNAINQNGTYFFAVNGQRPRGNNFMIDGVENNDISITGPAFIITNSDAIEEVVVQTADFSAEYGRAGGAVFNQVTKSGTNTLHGSAAWVYTGSAFQALNHLQQGLKSVPRQVRNIPDFTLGGPVVLPKLYNGRGKTFFFAAAQWDRRLGNITSTIRVPDAAGIATLQALAPQCPNAALYLKALGSFQGDTGRSKVLVPLNVPSAVGTCNNSTRTGMNLSTTLGTRVEFSPRLDNNHIIKIDHTVSDKQTMSFRWLYDQTTQTPDSPLNNLPGFDNNNFSDTMSGLFTDTYVINPQWTNEFRFNYGRIGFNFPSAATDAFHRNLPNYAGLGNQIVGFGVATNIPQFRFANNWQYQDTMSLLRGKHTFRFGVDFLRQLARQHPPFNERGSLTYSTSSGGVSAFANFLDDFGGNSGQLNQQFGNSVYYPNLFRQAYFFQDTWKTTSNLTLNIGLRYEYYGSPENIFTVAGFTNYDTVNFAAPHKVPAYTLNLGPSVGFAWNPKGANWLDRMMGGGKTVWRGGFQTSYDSSFNNLLSNMAGSSPNTAGANVVSPAAGRGAAKFTATLNALAPVVDKTSAQSNLFLGSFPNPQTHRWSLGFQRELPYGFFWETSYVGSVSRHLYRSLDMNPIVNAATGDRLHSELQNPLPANFATLSPGLKAQALALHQGQGQRTVRAASANSNYESLQASLLRNFKSTPIGEIQFQGSYTYGHYLDDVSDVFNRDSTPNSFESAPQVLGFSPHNDYGNSDYDRRHIGAVEILWSLPGPKSGLLGSLVGGWTLSGVSHWQTGQPYTLINGSDRGGYGQPNAERPDVSNLAAPLNTRAILKSSCSTGYGNPDLTGVPCVDPSTVHFIEGLGGPNARTVGRNTLRAPGVDNVDASIAKRFRFTESIGLEYRVEMYNALNTTNLGFNTAGGLNGYVPRTVNGSGAGTFLDFGQTDSIGRTMRMKLKLEF